MNKKLTEGSVFFNLVLFSLPFLLSNFLQTLYGMADLFIAGQFNGKEVITAVASGSQIMHMITVIIAGLAMGTAVLTARATGSENKKAFSLAAGNSFALYTIFSVLLASALVLFCPCIVKIMQTPGEAVSDTLSYLSLCFLGIPFIAVYNVSSAVFRGAGDSKTPLYFVIASCVLNIALDAFFMGTLKLGSKGAAAATVIAQAFSAVVCTACLVKSGSKKGSVALNKKDLSLKKDIALDLLKIGAPVSAQDGFIQVSFLIITAIANTRGVAVAAAVGIVEKIISFLFLVPSAMLSAISAIAAQCLGAGDHRRARHTLYCGMFMAALSGAVFSVLFQWTSYSFLSRFTGDGEVLTFGRQYLKTYVFDCFFAAFHFSFSGFFCAYGYSLLSFAHNAASIILVRVPLSYLASKFFPETLYPMGLAPALGSLLSSVICLIFYIAMKKKGLFDKRAVIAT